MDLMVYESLNDRELYSHSYRENAERETQTALDNALSWSSLTRRVCKRNRDRRGHRSVPAQCEQDPGILRLSAPVLEVLKKIQRPSP
jgi:ParB family chromosome partitioning protein